MRILISMLAFCALSACTDGESSLQVHIEDYEAKLTGKPETEVSEMPKSLRAAWVMSVQRDAGPKYALQESSGALGGVHPVQNLQVSFENERVALKTRGQTFAIGNAIVDGQKIGRQIMRWNDNHVDYKSQGTEEIFQWGPLGLEQSFVIAADKSPVGEKELQLEIPVGFDGYEVESRANNVTFKKGSHRLQVGDLYAFDANKRTLESRMTFINGALQIAVDVQDAAYPIVIDPVWSEAQKLVSTSGDLTGQDSFGGGVDIDEAGLVALVGARDDDAFGANAGAAYIFRRVAGVWEQSQKIFASDAAAGEGFGKSVALSGDGRTAVVGSFWGDIAGPNSGAVYVFRDDGDSFAETQQLIAADTVGGDRFGDTLAVADDGLTLIVGAPYTAMNVGAAYIFRESFGVFSESQKLSAGDGGSDDFFGVSLDLSGDGLVAVIGSQDSAQGSKSGAAYVFRDEGLLFDGGQKLLPDDGAANNYFGTSVGVSMDGTTVLIGALGGAGSAYVFRDNGGVLMQDQKITASEAGFSFGGHLGVSSDGFTILLSGRYGLSSADALGTAYLFEDNMGTFSETQRLEASDDIENGDSWSVVGLSGNGLTSIMGVPYGTDNNVESGVAYMFEDSGGLILEQAKLLPGGLPTHDSEFGSAVSVSDDGQTALVGCRVDAQCAYVFRETVAGYVETQKLRPNTSVPTEYFGGVVALSSDGLTAVVGNLHPVYGASSFLSGAVYIFREVGGIFVETQRLEAGDSANGNGFGFSAALSDDGMVLAVGAIGGTSAGAAYVFRDVGGTFGQTQKIVANDGESGDEFGSSVSLSDEGSVLLVGAHKDDDNIHNGGSAYIFKDVGANFVESQKLLPSQGDNWGHVGRVVSLSGSGTTALIGGNYVVGIHPSAAFVFKDDGAQFSETQRLAGDDGLSEYGFGTSLLLSGDGKTIVVGVVTADLAGLTSASSSVRFFREAGEAFVTQQEITVAQGGIGAGVALAEDDGMILTAGGGAIYVLDMADGCPQTCGGNASCQSQGALDQCVCDVGFSGDGFDCIDEDECALGIDGCDPLAVCENNMGSFTCICPEGYQANPAICVNIDECATSAPCSGNATCTDTDGGFICACNSGFVGDGMTCDADTDGDGVLDSIEDANGNGQHDFGETDFENSDTDGDGLCDGGHAVVGVCESGEDLNGNGIVDLGESNPYDPCDGSPVPGCDIDEDKDGVPAPTEALYGTEDGNPDADGDGICDGAETVYLVPGGGQSGVDEYANSGEAANLICEPAIDPETGEPIGDTNPGDPCFPDASHPSCTGVDAGMSDGDGGSVDEGDESNIDEVDAGPADVGDSPGGCPGCTANDSVSVFGFFALLIGARRRARRS